MPCPPLPIEIDEMNYFSRFRKIQRELDSVLPMLESTIQFVEALNKIGVSNNTLSTNLINELTELYTTTITYWKQLETHNSVEPRGSLGELAMFLQKAEDMKKIVEKNKRSAENKLCEIHCLLHQLKMPKLKTGTKKIWDSIQQHHAKHREEDRQAALKQVVSKIQEIEYAFERNVAINREAANNRLAELETARQKLLNLSMEELVRDKGVLKKAYPQLVE